MSKVYEARQRARAEQHALSPTSSTDAPVITAPTPPAVAVQPRTYELPLKREMLTLSQSLASATHLPAHPIVQFIGACEGEGTSTMTREFAKVCAHSKGQHVLLLDIHHGLSQTQHFAMRAHHCLDRLMHPEETVDSTTLQVGTSRLYVSALLPQLPGTTDPTEFERVRTIFAKIREAFDIIIIDSPPLNVSIDGLSLCKHVDGVVMVMQAERTRSAVIDHLKHQILQHGGTPLGLVFNQQQYYIPDAVYRRL